MGTLRKRLKLLRRVRKELQGRGYVFLAQEELPLLGDPRLLEAVSDGGLLCKEALPLVEEAIRIHEAPVGTRAEAALRRGDDKAARTPVWRGVLARPVGGPLPGEGVLALVLSEEASPPAPVVLVENLEAFYRFDPARLVLLPPGSRKELPLPEGPFTLLFRGGKGALALARKAGKVYLAFDLDLAGLVLAWHAAKELGESFAGLLYPGREGRKALIGRLSASPELVKRHQAHQQKYRSYRDGMPEPFAGLWTELLEGGVAVPQEAFFGP